MKLVVGEAVARVVGEIEALGGHVKDLAGDGVLAFIGGRLDVGWWSWVEGELGDPRVEAAPLRLTGWLPGYADPEYYLRLLFQSTSRTNEGGFADPAFDDLIERARQERSDHGRLERFHEADRYAIADRVAVIPLVYGRSTAFVHPHVRGWWEFGKSSASFADLQVERGLT